MPPTNPPLQPRETSPRIWDYTWENSPGDRRLGTTTVRLDLRSTPRLMSWLTDDDGNKYPTAIALATLQQIISDAEKRLK